MTRAEYAAKAHEVDRLLNDPSFSLDPMRIWTLLSELAGATAFDAGPDDEYAPPKPSVGQGEAS
jgi:hypothetical protein